MGVCVVYKPDHYTNPAFKSFQSVMELVVTATDGPERLKRIMFAGIGDEKHLKSCMFAHANAWKREMDTVIAVKQEDVLMSFTKASRIMYRKDWGLLVDLVNDDLCKVDDHKRIVDMEFKERMQSIRDVWCDVDMCDPEYIPVPLYNAPTPRFRLVKIQGNPPIITKMVVWAQ